VVIGRTTKMGDHTVGKAMGVNTWAAFAGGDDKAVVDGDFAMLESELQPVLKALRAGGIDVVAIHNHMTGETPRIMFLHFWGVGPTEALAKTLKAALAQTKHLPPAPCPCARSSGTSCTSARSGSAGRSHWPVTCSATS